MRDKIVIEINSIIVNNRLLATSFIKEIKGHK